MFLSLAQTQTSACARVEFLSAHAQSALYSLPGSATRRSAHFVQELPVVVFPNSLPLLFASIRAGTSHSGEPVLCVSRRATNPIDPLPDRLMGPRLNLILYASVCTRSNHTIAEYLDGDGELPHMASKCLQLLPPHHSRFSHTANRRMFACIIEEPFLFCSIADEALSRSQVMSFLEQVQHEFTSYAYAVGLMADQSRLERQSLDSVFKPVFQDLASPYVGIPQKEKDRIAEEILDKQMYADAEADVEAGHSLPTYYDRYGNQASPCIDVSSGSRSPSRPLISKSGSTKYKQKKHKDDTRDVGVIVDDGKGRPFDRLEIAREVTNPQLHRIGSAKSFRSQQMVQRMWWRSVRMVLLLDLLICLVLFGIWLGICKGFSCTK